MLYLDEDGLVQVDPNVKNVPEVVALRKKSQDSKEFLRWITYAYHLYKKDHILSNFGRDERKNRVISMYFQGEDVSFIENQPEFAEFRNMYIELQYTPAGKFIEALKVDMDQILEHIRNIPLSRETIVDVQVKDATGITTQKKLLPVDNSEEKFAALKRAESILTMYDKFNERMRQEEKDEKRKTGARRMFDKRDAFKR